MNLVDVIKKHEGCRLDVQRYSRCLDNRLWFQLGRGIDQETADFILARDLEKHSQELISINNVERLPDPAQIVLLSCNSPWAGIDSKFVKFWEAIEKRLPNCW